jgi:hypothetical protein
MGIAHLPNQDGAASVRCRLSFGDEVIPAIACRHLGACMSRRFIFT